MTRPPQDTTPPTSKISSRSPRPTKSRACRRSNSTAATRRRRPSCAAPRRSAPTGSTRPGARRLPHDRRRARCSMSARRERQEAHRQPCARRGPNRIARMIAQTASMVFVIDRDRDRGAAARDQSHQAAEAALQRADARRQVVSLYPHHRRSSRAADHQASRRAEPRKGDYFGPFASVWAVNRTSTRCSAPSCCAPAPTALTPTARGPACSIRSSAARRPARARSSQPTMRELVAGGATISSPAKAARCRRRLARRDEEAAELLDFERAARLRDRIAALSAIQGAQGINPKTDRRGGCFRRHRRGGQFCVEVFFFRTYQNWGNRAYFPRADKSLAPAEVLDAFLAQFYADKPPPRLILLRMKSRSASCWRRPCAKAGHASTSPRRSAAKKRDLVEQALAERARGIGRKFAETASQTKLLAALAEAFGLAAPPRRIEIYDNSHIMGANAVGAMIVAGRGRLHESALPHV